MTDEAKDDRGESVAEVKDEYSEAWDEAQGIGDKADPQPAAEPPVETPPEPKGQDDVEKPEVQKEPVQPTSDADEKYEQRYKTLQGIHKHDKEAWETEKAKLLSELEEAKKPKEPTKEQKESADAFVDSLTDEQKKQLADYEADFDVVSRMEGIKRKVELAKLRKEIQSWKDEITSKLTEQMTKLDPVITRTEELEVKTHFDTIRSAHSDFEQFRDDGSLQAWIKSKPKYLQPALQNTYSQGSAADVIEMIDDFKRENKITVGTPDNVVKIDPNKAAKKQALTSVVSRRGAVNAAHSVATDYDSAWEEANAKLGG